MSLKFLSNDIAITEIDADFNQLIYCIENINNNTEFEKVFYRPHLTMKIPIDLDDINTKHLYLIKKIMINIKDLFKKYQIIKKIYGKIEIQKLTIS